MSKNISRGFNFSAILPYGAAILGFLFLSVFYFYPQLEGKKIQQADISSYEAMAHEASAHEKKTGHYPLWTNSMFGGMPTYQLGAPQKNNISRVFERAANLFLKRPIGYFFAAMLCFFILLLSLGVNTWLSIIGSIAFSFSTNNLILFEAGHTSKLRVIIFSALVIAGFLNVFQNRYKIGLILYSLGMGISIYANHIQMTYILGIILAIYALFKLVEAIIEKNIKPFVKACLFIVLGSAIALGTSASKLLTTYQYMEDTMRGAPILKNSVAGDISSSTTKGLSWEYANSWSNGTIDLFSAIIPGVAGGGSAEPLSKNSAVAKDLRAKGARIEVGPLYWGKLPGTSGPIYFGALSMFLFIFGLLLLKGPLRWGFGLAVLVTFMLSMGSNLEWFNRIFFDYFPLYNKFRTPNSILSVTALIIPMIGMLGLQRVFRGDLQKKEILNKLYISTGILAGICLVFSLFGSTFFDFSNPSDSRYGEMGYSVHAITTDRISLMRTDALRSLLFILLGAGVIWAYLTERLKKLPVFALLGLLILFDLWGVGKRYLNNADFSPERQLRQTHAPREVDKLILKDKDLYYRVHDITADPFNSSSASYHHKTIGGYHPAKLQRYQDMIDTYISQGNMNVLNMLNTKYFIVNDNQGQPKVQVNTQALGNAWFADTILTVPSNDAEIMALGNADLETTAFVHKDFQEYLEGISPGGGGNIELTSYDPEILSYKSNSNREGMVVFSDIWYGPKKGWQAYIDDEPVEHIRANYCLRALKVPAGQHTIRFEFKPALFQIGETISLLSSLALLGLIAFFAYQIYKDRYKSS